MGKEEASGDKRFECELGVRACDLHSALCIYKEVAQQKLATETGHETNHETCQLTHSLSSLTGELPPVSFRFRLRISPESPLSILTYQPRTPPHSQFFTLPPHPASRHRVPSVAQNVNTSASPPARSQHLASSVQHPASSVQHPAPSNQQPAASTSKQ